MVLGVRVATRTAAANQHDAQSLRRSKVRAARCVSYTTNRHQGFAELSEGCMLRRSTLAAAAGEL